MLRKFLEWQAEKDYKTLELFLKDKHLSRRLITKLKYIECLHLNNQPVFTIAKVQKGDVIKVIFPYEDQISCAPEDVDIAIVYEDLDILVVDKPYGMATHPASGTCDGTLANAVTNYYIKSGYQIPFHPVSRLDKDTSGLIVIAKNQFTKKVLSLQMQNQLYKKTYLAKVSGLIEKDGEIILPIARESADSILRVVRSDGKFAHTVYKVLKQEENATLLEVALKTGRTHQIRVHMQAIGHPIVGDPLYGSKPCHRMCLHACETEFVHPVTHETMRFRSDKYQFESGT